MQARDLSTDWVSSLHTAHGAQLQQFLVRMLGRKEAAEEVAQETYLKLYRLCSSAEVVCPKALLFDAATKLALSYLKRRRAETARLHSPPEGWQMEEIADDLARPERVAAAQQAVQRLAHVVDQLPVNLQRVFVLRYARQLSRQEIADRLHISVNAVEQRLTRALALCRTRLAALGLDWPSLD